MHSQSRKYEDIINTVLLPNLVAVTFLLPVGETATATIVTNSEFGNYSARSKIHDSGIIQV
jgi:hypothetical protein